MSPDAVAGRSAGPLTGIRVLELAGELGAYAGKLLADFGAEVLLVEPPGGHATRRFEPFAESLPEGHPDRSLWFWHYNTSKAGIELDLRSPEGAAAFRDLVAHADVVLESEPPGHLAALGLDAAQLRGSDSPLVWVSVTPFGRDDPRSSEPFTDLTAMAGGGIVWSCGYDNPSLPPVRTLGNQAYHTAGIWAALGALLALRTSVAGGRGQLVDVSMHAAVNVTTEQATQWYLVAGREVRRQTGRHAMPVPTEPLVVRDRNGNEVNTGFPPHQQQPLQVLVDWVDELGFRDELPEVGLVELAIEQGGLDLTRLADDPLVQECYRASRQVMAGVAARLDGHDFFIQAQDRGFPVGVINAVEETMADRHLAARGFPTPVFQPQLGREVVHPGLPVRFTATPGSLRPAPGVGAGAGAGPA